MHKSIVLFFPQRMSGGGIPRTRFPYYLTSALRGLLQYPSTHIIDIPNRCRRVHAHVPTTSRSNSPICMSTHNHAWYPLPCVFVKQRQTKLLLFPEPSMDSTRLPKLTFYPGFPPPPPAQVRYFPPCLLLHTVYGELRADFAWLGPFACCKRQ